MKSLNALEWIVLVLTIIGGINWGLVGAFNLNLVDTVFGSMSMITRVIYILVGLSGLYLIFLVGKLGRKS